MTYLGVSYLTAVIECVRGLGCGDPVFQATPMCA